MGEAHSFYQYKKTSDLLIQFIKGSRGEHKISFSELTSVFQQRSYAGLFFILALLSFLPAISILAGLAMVLPGIQMLLGKKIPALPKRLNQTKVSVERLNRIFHWLSPKLIRLELWVKPRWFLMLSPAMHKFFGVVALVLAVIIAVPFPLSNILPAIAMLFISVGLLEKDGICIAIGLAISSIAIALSVMLVQGLYFSLEHFFLT